MPFFHTLLYLSFFLSVCLSLFSLLPPLSLIIDLRLHTFRLSSVCTGLIAKDPLGNDCRALRNRMWEDMLKGHFYLKSLCQDAISSFAACLYCHRSAAMLPGCKCVGLLPRLNFSFDFQPRIYRRFENSQKNATFDIHDLKVFFL